MPRSKKSSTLTQSEQVQRGPWVRACNACDAIREEVGRCESCGCPEFRMVPMVEVETTITPTESERRDGDD